jgi:1,5-anhydro-D-fructose reductase (1,5-anhydro-D-mannitol-forming)
LTVRVGLVGCGFIGTVHSFALHQLIKAGLVDATVVATYDVDPARAQQQAAVHGAVAHERVDDLMATVDAVWVCTWTAAHLEVVRAATEQSLAVFCEKPLAPTLDECVTVARLLDTVPHQVGLVLRHAPVFRTIADEVASGRHGAPMATVMRDDQYFPNQGMYASSWRADVTLAGGGTLVEHSIHDVDVLRWILGDPQSVTARTSSRFGHPGIDDIAAATLTYADGSVATLTSVWHQVLSRPSTRRLEVFCEEALLWADDDSLGPVHVETSAGTEVRTAAPPEWTDRFELSEVHAKQLAQYAAPAKAFLDALCSGGRATAFPDAATALAAHRIVDAAYRSAAAGGPTLPIAGAPTA